MCIVQVLKYVEVLPHALDVNVNVKYAFEDATEISVKFIILKYTIVASSIFFSPDRIKSISRTLSSVIMNLQEVGALKINV
jgi:hypothetical protein